MFLYFSSTACLVLSLVSVPYTTSSPGIGTKHILHRTARQASSCGRLQFRCNNGDCISTYSVCDGPKDCSDGSDETRDACRAANIPCPNLAFECAYGACIDGKLRCDKKEDCADGSDETDCPKNETSSSPATPNSCGHLKYKCANGQCINTYDTCDGFKNCDDGTDETRQLCENIQCLRGSYQCAYGACMDPSVKCNGKFDCPDKSDEYDNCPSNPNLPSNIPDQPNPVGSCRLPKHPKNGFYTSDCRPNDPEPACRNDPGTVVPNRWSIKYTCNHGYNLDKELEFSICEDGTWRNVPECIKLCEPLISTSVHVTCKLEEKEVPCNKSMKPGTKATPRCNQFYNLTYPPEYSSLLCLADGTWSHRLYQCTPVCGIQGSQRPLIYNGIESKQGEFPWLAAIYYRTEAQEFEQRCGGTLITPHIVLTAAHCVVNKNTNKLLDSRELKIGLGKYHRDFKVEEAGSEIVDVKKVVVPRQYAGTQSNYALDIALLDMITSVQVTAVIMPACVDWRGIYSPAPEMVGKVAGWGATEDNNKASSVVLSANMSFIKYDVCLKSLRATKKPLLTHDKFCAGSINGSRVDSGDSGGGLTFLFNGLYFVIGIVSTKFTDEGKIFTLFTDVTTSLQWLEEKVTQLKVVHREL